MQQLSLKHVVREAAAPGTPAPLLIMLHGVGSNERDLLGLAPELDPRFFLVSARAPITRQPGSYAWYNVQFLPGGDFLIDEQDAERSRKLLLRFIDEVKQAYPVDPERVYLVGFSQGAIMSVAAALSEPEKVRGVVAMSGRLLPGLTERIAAPDRLRNLSILQIHGTEDAVIRVNYGRELRDSLAKLPVDLEYHEYPMGHWVTPESLAAVRDWLARHLG